MSEDDDDSVVSNK